MYVPWPGTIREFFEQLFGVSVSSVPTVDGSSRPHNVTVERTNGIDGAPGVSFAVGVTDWFTSCPALPVFTDAVGNGGAVTVGVIVELAT